VTTITLEVPNAIVFVFDPSHPDIIIPEYIPGEVVASNPACISVATLPDADGAVTLRLGVGSVDRSDPALKPVFDGALETPGGRVAIVTSDSRPVLEQAVNGPTTGLTIAVDDTNSPGVIEVIVA